MSEAVQVSTSDKLDQLRKDMFSDKSKNITYIFAGVIFLAFFIMLFKFNKNMFIGLLCIYLAIYAGLVMYVTNDKKIKYNDKSEYRAMEYITMYTCIGATVMFFFVVLVWGGGDSQPVVVKRTLFN